jgi:hypothetical protein
VTTAPETAAQHQPRGNSVVSGSVTFAPPDRVYSLDGTEASARDGRRRDVPQLTRNHLCDRNPHDIQSVAVLDFDHVPFGALGEPDESIKENFVCQIYTRSVDVREALIWQDQMIGWEAARVRIECRHLDAQSDTRAHRLEPE